VFEVTCCPLETAELGCSPEVWQNLLGMPQTIPGNVHDIYIYIELYNSYSNLKGSQRISKDLKGTLGLELARNLGWVELFSSRVAQLAAGSWS
jgi:hypothetical protein